jgi:hypothetical protein
MRGNVEEVRTFAPDPLDATTRHGTEIVHPESGSSVIAPPGRIGGFGWNGRKRD